MSYYDGICILWMEFARVEAGRLGFCSDPHLPSHVPLAFRRPPPPRRGRQLRRRQRRGRRGVQRPLPQAHGVPVQTLDGAARAQLHTPRSWQIGRQLHPVNVSKINQQCNIKKYHELIRRQ